MIATTHSNVFVTSLLVFICIFLMNGCNNGHVPLTGTISFSDDQSPVNVGSVILSSNTFQASGDLKTDGSFVIGSYAKTDGLPPGEYTVIVSAFEYLADGGTYSLIDPKYNNAGQTGMKYNIDRKTRHLDIKVDRNPSPRPK